MLHFWNKFGIRAQITSGFVPLILLMSLLTVSAISGMNGLASIFASYRATAGQSLAISDYSDQLNEIRCRRKPSARRRLRLWSTAFAPA